MILALALALAAAASVPLARAGPPSGMCLLQTKLYPGVQLHDAHPAVDLGNKPNLTVLECAEWCCGRDDCKCFYHTTSQPHDGLNCKGGEPCCWLKPTFNATRIHDAADCQGEHHCMSGVREDVSE